MHNSEEGETIISLKLSLAKLRTVTSLFLETVILHLCDMLLEHTSEANTQLFYDMQDLLSELDCLIRREHKALENSLQSEHWVYNIDF